MLAWPADWERLYSLAIHSCVNRLTCFVHPSPWRTHIGFIHKLLTVTYVECSSPFWESKLSVFPTCPTCLRSVLRKENCPWKTVGTPKDLKMSNSLISISNQRIAGFRIAAHMEQLNEKVKTFWTSVRANSCSLAVHECSKGRYWLALGTSISSRNQFWQGGILLLKWTFLPCTKFKFWLLWQLIGIKKKTHLFSE